MFYKWWFRVYISYECKGLESGLTHCVDCIDYTCCNGCIVCVTYSDCTGCIACIIYIHCIDLLIILFLFLIFIYFYF